MDSNIKRPKINLLRFAFISVVLCVVMVVSFSFYGDGFAGIMQKINESSNDMTNMKWVANHLGNLVPGIAIIIFQAVAYCFVEDKASAHKEQKWQALILLVLVYAVLLPYAIGQTEAGVISSIESSSLWFCTQLIPLIIIMTYHSQRCNFLYAEAKKAALEAEINATEGNAEETKA